MDSPVRQYQKQKDYQRHKLFRKIRRRRKAEAQQAMDAPMKELKRRLKRYDDGKNVPMDRSIDGVNLWRDDQTGQYFYQEANGPRIDLTPFNTLGSDDPTTWSFLDAEGKEYNPRRQQTGTTISKTTDAQRVANEARDVQNTRTWRSDVADQLHNFGDALMWSTMAMNPEGEALMMKASEKVTPYVERMIKGIPWTYRIPENPNMAYRIMGPLERDWIMQGNELSTRATNSLTASEETAARSAEQAVNPKRRFTLYKAGAEHGGRKQFAKGQPWQGTTVTHGEKQVLAIPGEGLPWVSGRHYHGPQGNGFGIGEIPFEEAPFGSHIDLLTKEGYTGINPSLLDGSVIYSPYKILGRNFGYKKLYPKITTPQITAENAAQLLQQQSKRFGGDLKYGTPNLFEKYIYGRKINGLSVDPFDLAKQPYSDSLNEQWSKDVVRGLSADAKQSLLDETIARNVRAFEEQGVDPLAIQEYRNKAAALMDDVRVGRYTNQDYIKAGKDDIGGFYDDKRNFLSVNTESGFPDGFVEKHEGRHLLDYKLDDDILMGTNAYRNNLGSDFDSDATAKAMRMAVQKQNDVLTKAYDMDFVNLPNTKYAGSLKGYPHMERETVTTNADSRRILFDKKHANNWSLELKDKLIDKVPKEDIFDAVEQANGYGRRYIQFLRDNGKLTEEKANQFREAMKYKGILAVPMAVSAGYGLTGESNGVTFNKGKDSGIHIKPENRGKFTALKKRTGKTTEQLTHSKNPLTRKRAIFAQNARKWHHK